MNVYDFDGTICFKSSPIVFWKICIKRKPIILICLPIQTVGFLLYKYGLIKDPSLFYIFTRFFKDETKVIKEFCDTQEKNMCEWYLKQKMDDDIIVSASPEFLIKEMAKRLNVSYVASKVDFRTGKFIDPPC